jgi:hypothetical protein
MAELGKKEDPVAQHGHCAKLAKSLAQPTVLAGGFINNRQRHGNIRCRGSRWKEEMEVGLLHIAVNKGDRFSTGERVGKICGYHTLAGTAFAACNCEFHVSSPCEIIGVSPARVCFPASPCYERARVFFVNWLNASFTDPLAL